MDQKMFLAIGLSMVVIVAFYAIFPPPVKPPTPEPGMELTQPGARDLQGALSRTAAEDFAPPETVPGRAPDSSLTEATAKIVTVETPNYLASFDTRGGTLKSFQLKKYRAGMERINWGDVIPPLRKYLDKYEVDPEARVEMVKKDLVATEPFGLWFVENGQLTSELAHVVYAADSESIVLKAGDAPATLVLRGRTSDGVTVVKSITFGPDDYLLDYEVSVINYSDTYQELRTRHLFGEGAQPSGTESSYQAHWGPIYQADDSVETEDPEDVQQLFIVRDAGWVGITDTYFLSAVKNESTVSYSFYKSEPNPVVGAEPEWIAHYGVELPAVSLAPNKQITSHFKMFLGPKKTEEMEKFGEGLEGALDLGVLEIISKPMLAMLRWFYGYTGNFGVAIILLTIVVRVALFPLTYKGMASMKRMQKLQPKMKAIREKFKKDKERLNKEMMLLYKRGKVNPLGGCLPLLLQMPIFFALYWALSGAIELRHSPFIFWVTDLSAPDGLYVTPILMGISMMAQQKLTPTTPDPMQARIMMWMPAIFTVFMLQFPAGLTTYWLTSNLLSIVQQLVINRIKVADPTELPA